MTITRSVYTLGIFFLLLLTSAACQQPAATVATPTLEFLSIDPTATATQTPTMEFTPTVTTTMEPMETPSPTVTLNPIQEYGIYWMASFETGDISEFEEYNGEFLRQSPYGWYAISNQQASRGNYSVALTIDTEQLSGGAAASYLAYYNNPREGYYSGWIYIPENVTPLTWWNIWQWKSTYNGNSDESLPMWVLDLTTIPTNAEELRLTLVYRPDSETLKQSYTNVNAIIPKGEWVHISTYYQKSSGSDGGVGVWINGEEIFYIENAHTVLADNTLYWLVNNYTERIQPSPCTIYFDDLVISQRRIEPESILP